MAILAQTDPTYQPALRIIDDITRANPALVTTSFDHDYKTGTIVRFVVPDGYGMKQLNNKFGVITVTDTNMFTVDINTTNFDAYTTPTTYPENKQYAQVIPIGEINEMLTAATDNILG